jgi:hypothetical protein
VDGALYDAIRAILLLGMALLAWREFRRIRADIAERKRREKDDSFQS